MSDWNQKKMDELSLQIFGKKRAELTREEFNILKKHPEWIAAAYGTDPRKLLGGT